MHRHAAVKLVRRPEGRYRLTTPSVSAAEHHTATQMAKRCSSAKVAPPGTAGKLYNSDAFLHC